MEHLPEVVFADNTSVHSSTGCMLYFLMLSRSHYLPVDILLGVRDECSPEVGSKRRDANPVWGQVGDQKEAEADIQPGMQEQEQSKGV